MSVACISLDLEPDFAGWMPATYTGWDAARVEGLMALLKKYDAPLSIFVVAGSLNARPDVIDVFRAHGAEFHLHSFSHDLAQPDSADEIAQPFGSAPGSAPRSPGSKHSAHQPSSTEQCSAPFITAFMPLVPEASIGRTGVLSHTSAPWTSERASAMS